MKKVACIVLPTYNEAKNLPVLLPLILRQSENIPNHELHVLVVDDNSPDGTADHVRDAMELFPCLHLMTGEKKGLGDAYKRGITHAMKMLQPHLILQMDADFQHDPALLPRFIRLSEGGYDLVIGSRFVSGASMPSLRRHRKLLSIVGNRLVRWVGRIPSIRDCTSGYRCIKADLLRRCDLAPLSTRGYSFQSWLLCELLQKGARAIETPIIFHHRHLGKSKLSFRDQFEFIVNLARLPRGSRNEASQNWPEASATVEEKLEAEPDAVSVARK